MQHPGAATSWPASCPALPCPVLLTLDAHSNNQIQGFLGLAWICGERNIPYFHDSFSIGECIKLAMHSGMQQCRLSLSLSLFLFLLGTLNSGSTLSRSFALSRHPEIMSKDAMPCHGWARTEARVARFLKIGRMGKTGLDIGRLPSSGTCGRYH